MTNLVEQKRPDTRGLWKNRGKYVVLRDGGGLNVGGRSWSYYEGRGTNEKVGKRRKAQPRHVGGSGCPGSYANSGQVVDGGFQAKMEIA
jgi:hypothetical protein